MKETVKRWKTLLIATIMVFGIISNSFTTIAIAAEGEYNVSTEESDTIGDADFDEKIDIRDASIILDFYARIAAGFKDVTTPAEFKASDVNRNGAIDISDATLVLSHYAKCAAGLYDDWPPIASSEVTTTTSNVTTTTTTVETVETTTTTASSGSFLIGDVIANSRLWTLHSKPDGSTDNIICMIPAETKLEVVGYVDDSWYLVKYQNLIMYVELDYKYFHKLDVSTTMATTLPETSTTSLVTTTLSEAATTSTAMTTTESEPSTTMTTTLSEMSTTSTTTSTTDVIHSYKMGDVIEFSGSKWNIRNGIGTDADTVGTLFGGDSVVVVGYAGYTDYDWYKIVFNGNIGYIGLQSPWCFTKTREVCECDEPASNASAGTFLRFIGDSWYLRDEAYSIVGSISNNRMMIIEEVFDDAYRVVVENSSESYIIRKNSDFDAYFIVYR